MVNVFGEDETKGAPGRDGKDGKDGEPNISTVFFGKFLLKWFNELLTLSFYFDTPTSGIKMKEGKPVALLNQNGGNNAIPIKDVGTLSMIPYSRKYALNFKDTVYKVDDVDWTTVPTEKAIFIFAFKTNTTNKQYIFHTKNTSGAAREIYLEHDNIVINDDAVIEYCKNSWNICYIEYGESSSYWINGKTGTFTTKVTQSEDLILYIGGKDGYTFTGSIARFDFYSQHHPKDEILPVDIRDVIIYQFKELVPFDIE